MIFNQTSNPFGKKNQELSVSYQPGVSPDREQRKNMFEMSMNYTKLMEENNELKRQVMGKKKGGDMLDKSRNMMELLGDIDREEV